MAEQPVRAGLGVRAQPRRDVHTEHDPPGHPRQWQPVERLTESGDLDLPGVQPVIKAAVPAAMFRFQRQLRQ
jgi:hypothetical protein